MEPGSAERHLDLDAPLMSTRRPNKMNHFNSRRVDTSRRVPFLWERAPGVPKDWVRAEEDELMPAPKPPPGRWRPSRDPNYDPNGSDGDVDDCSATSDDIFADALDKISLSESFGVACRLSGFDGLGSKGIELEPSVQQSPSFIMDRFLPAATALAVTSTFSNPTYSKPRPASYYSHRLQTELKHIRTTTHATKLPIHTTPCVETRSRSPPKTCGLMPLLPWSFKRTLCGIKSPVRSQTPRANFDALTIRTTKRGSGDGLSSEAVDDGRVGYVDKLRIKACKSPGWGLPFLDTSRLRLRGRNLDRGKKNFMAAKEFECGSTERSLKRSGCGVRPERGRPMWSLPQLKSPSDPWLSHALNSVNRR